MKIKVLIVDDQELIRKSLAIVLDMNSDIEVVGTAENGWTAVEKTSELQPDIVLMDIHMPLLDGVEATIKIKESWPQIKVMILTTFQDVHYVIGALNAGAEGYILKAIDPMDLTSAIRLVNRGEMMINQELAKAAFASLFQSGLHTASAKDSVYGLTDREREVLKLISDGLSNRQISERMFLSEGTVKNYVSNIYSKLNVQNQMSAMKKVSDERLIKVHLEMDQKNT